MAENFTRRDGPPGMADASPAGRGGVDRPGRPDESGKAREAMDEARQKAASLASEAKAEGKTVLSQQKEGAAEQVGSVASALRSAADDLQQRDPGAGRFVSYAADRLESFGRQVRDKDIDSLIGDAERLGRRSPAVFFAGSVALGFLLSRFLKSSSHSKDSQRRRSESSTPRIDRLLAAAQHDWNARRCRFRARTDELHAG
jgi:vacuolar-type H+-ATPase subunit H